MHQISCHFLKRECMSKTLLPKLQFTPPTRLLTIKPFSKTSGTSAEDDDAIPAAELKRAFSVAYHQRFDIRPSASLLHDAMQVMQKKNADVSKQLYDLIAIFGKEETKTLISNAPHLLTSDVTALTAQLAELGNLYEWSEEEAKRVVMKDTAVLDKSVEEHASWIRQVATLLAITESHLKQSLRRRIIRRGVNVFPAILSISPGAIAAKIISLWTAFDGQGVNISSLVSEDLEILEWSLRNAILNVDAVTSELSPVLPYNARKVFVASPSLLDDDYALLRGRVRALVDMCKTDPKWMRELQRMEPWWLGGILCMEKKRFARLRFYKSCTRAEMSLQAFCHMTYREFDSAYPDFEIWWEVDQAKNNR